MSNNGHENSDCQTQPDNAMERHALSSSADGPELRRENRRGDHNLSQRQKLGLSARRPAAGPYPEVSVVSDASTLV